MAKEKELQGQPLDLKRTTMMLRKEADNKAYDILAQRFKELEQKSKHLFELVCLLLEVHGNTRITQDRLLNLPPSRDGWELIEMHDIQNNSWEIRLETPKS